MSRSTPIHVALAAALLVSCGVDEATQPADFCRDDEAECLDENTLRTCQAARWQIIGCAEWCSADSAGGRSQGCLRLIDRGDECACSGSRGRAEIEE